MLTDGISSAFNAVCIDARVLAWCQSRCNMVRLRAVCLVSDAMLSGEVCFVACLPSLDSVAASLLTAVVVPATLFHALVLHV